MRVIVGLVCLLTCCVAAVAASADRGRVEIGFDVGYAGLDDEMGGSGELATIRGGYHVSRRFAVEGQLEGMFPGCSDADVFCPDVRILYANALYNFHPKPSIEPYLLFGAGYTDFEDDDAANTIPGIEDPFEGQVVIQTGMGSRFFFGEKRRTAARLELSGTWFEDTNHANVQFGLLWRLGKGW